jgi:hypothetical protein
MTTSLERIEVADSSLTYVRHGSSLSVKNLSISTRSVKPLSCFATRAFVASPSLHLDRAKQACEISAGMPFAVAYHVPLGLGIVWTLDSLGMHADYGDVANAGKVGVGAIQPSVARLIQHIMLYSQQLSYAAACPLPCSTCIPQLRLKFIRKSKTARRERAGRKNGNND